MWKTEKQRSDGREEEWAMAKEYQKDDELKKTAVKGVVYLTRTMTFKLFIFSRTNLGLHFRSSL